MKYRCDLHIHSALSPCADDDMTPFNIVNMAKLAGLDVIAITDHNTAGNCFATEAEGKKIGLTVLSGIELETSEEVHVVLLFPSAKKAKACSDEVAARRIRIKNRPEVFGRQLYMGENDEILGDEPDLLITATTVSVTEAVALAKRHGGIAFPAHVDRPAHGILQMLGEIDETLGFTTVETSRNATKEFIEELEKKYRVVRDSDAHRLEDVNEEQVNFLELDELTPEKVIEKLGQR